LTQRDPTSSDFPDNHELADTINGFFIYLSQSRLSPCRPGLRLGGFLELT